MLQTAAFSAAFSLIFRLRKFTNTNEDS